MGTRPLNYAEPVRLDPLPALRRIRALAIVWALLVISSEVCDLTMTVHWPQNGGWGTYLQNPVWVYANALGAVLLTCSVLAWRGLDPGRRRGAIALLAGAAAAMPLVTLVGGVATSQLVPTMALLINEFARFALLASVPLAVVWAAIRPQTFTAARVASIAGLSMLFAVAFTGFSIASLAASVSPWSGSFWSTLLSRGWINAVVKAACTLVAATLFGLAIRRLRRGRSAAPAVWASWLLVALVGWLCLTSYGVWWNAWELPAWLRAVQIVSRALYLLLLLCAGLAFLVPLTPDRTLTALP